MELFTPYFLTFHLILTLSEYLVHGLLKYPLPEKCKRSIGCYFTSVPGDSLQPQDLDDFPHLRILHDLQPKSTIMDKFATTPTYHTISVIRIHVNGYIYMRDDIYFYKEKEELLFPKSEPLSPHNKTYPNFIECLTEHCKQKGENLHFLRCSPETKNVAVWDNLMFLPDEENITYPCISNITYIDLRGIRFNTSKTGKLTYKNIYRLRLENANFGTFIYQYASELLDSARILDVTTFENPSVLNYTLNLHRGTLEVRFPKYIFWIESTRNKSNFSLATNCLTTEDSLKLGGSKIERCFSDFYDFNRTNPDEINKQRLLSGDKINWNGIFNFHLPMAAIIILIVIALVIKFY